MGPRYAASVTREPGSVPRRAGRAWPVGVTAAADLSAEQLDALRQTQGYGLTDIQERHGRATRSAEGVAPGKGGDAQVGAPAPAPRAARRKRVADDDA